MEKISNNKIVKIVIIVIIVILAIKCLTQVYWIVDNVLEVKEPYEIDLDYKEFKITGDPYLEYTGEESGGYIKKYALHIPIVSIGNQPVELTNTWDLVEVIGNDNGHVELDSREYNSYSRYTEGILPPGYSGEIVANLKIYSDCEQYKVRVKTLSCVDEKQCKYEKYTFDGPKKQ